jgi:hypothetical protein
MNGRKLGFNALGKAQLQASGIPYKDFFKELDDLNEKKLWDSVFRRARSKRGINVNDFKALVARINALRLERPRDGSVIEIDPVAHAEPPEEDDSRKKHSAQSNRAAYLPTEPPGVVESVANTINLPYRKNQFFTGRERQLGTLSTLLTSENRRLVAVSGLGGVGKTQLVVEYIYQLGGRHSHILWTSADTRESIADGCYQLAKSLGLPVDYSDPVSAFAVLGKWMRHESNWVLVLDNADHPRVLDGLIPEHIGGHVVITSRAQVFDRLGRVESVPLDYFSPEESCQFLKSRTKRDTLTRNEEDAASKLGTTLRGLALALEQAAAFIAETGVSFARYLRCYESEGVPFLEKHPPEVGAYPATVATTWYFNFREVNAESPTSIELLRCAAFLRSPADDPSLPIPFTYLTDTPEGLDAQLAPQLRQRLLAAEDRTLVLSDILRPLMRFSLVTIDRPEQSFVIHPLVLAVMRSLPDL